ncbi:hypothetical protein V8E51_003780 [Hyaloscypha variabilis]
MAVNNVASNIFEDLFTSDTAKREAFLEVLGGKKADIEKYGLYFTQLKEICLRISGKEVKTMSARSGTEVLNCMKEVWSYPDISNCQRPALRKKLREKFYPSPISSVPPKAAEVVDGASSTVSSSTQATASQIQGPATPLVKDEHIDNTINLILHILLTINIGEKDTDSGLGDEVSWNDTDTLSKFVAAQFPKAKEAENVEPEKMVAIDGKFTAASLWDKRGIKVVPNFDLRDHLKYVSTQGSQEIKGTVQVYPLRRWLDMHQQQGKKGLLSETLVKETLDSLALLFPFWQPTVNEEYLKSIGFAKMINCELPFDSLDAEMISLDHFTIWRDRFEEIYKVYKGPPISQWQKFREDKIGWFSFWGAVVCIVVMTFIFGVLAVTFAILAWAKAHADADDLLDVVKELLDVVKKVAESNAAVVERAPTVTVTVTAVRF